MQSNNLVSPRAGRRVKKESPADSPTLKSHGKPSLVTQGCSPRYLGG